MSTLADIRDKVVGMVKDTSGKLTNPGDFDRNITAALARYSRHMPDTAVVDVTGNGTNDYSVSLLTGWVDGFSDVRQVEFPVDEVPESLLDGDEFHIYQKPSGKVLRLASEQPAATEAFRATFTIPRAATTVPDGDVDAISQLAASLCCEELANAYAQTGDPTIGADSVNYRSKSQEFASRAKRLMQLYKEHMGIKGDDAAPAASAVADLDMGYPGGGDRLTHPRRGRERR